VLTLTFLTDNTDYKHLLKMSDEILNSIDSKLSAILGLLVDAREKSDNPQKVDVILANAGLRATEISKLTGRKLTTVQKTLERARK